MNMRDIPQLLDDMLDSVLAVDCTILWGTFETHIPLLEAPLRLLRQQFP